MTQFKGKDNVFKNEKGTPPKKGRDKQEQSQ